jgi:hypothetical protein
LWLGLELVTQALVYADLLPALKGEACLSFLS